MALKQRAEPVHYYVMTKEDLVELEKGNSVELTLYPNNQCAVIVLLPVT